MHAAGGKRLDIQGLRAVAVLLVVLYHADLPGLPGGYVGVDVFFVISGYLMTAHLVRPLHNGDRVRFLPFYARRVKRLLPAALLVIVTTLVASLYFLSPIRERGLAEDAAASALYVPNLWFAKQGTNYLTVSVPSPFQHYWSLGVEEQFYLGWPLLIALVWLLSRRKVSALPIALAAVSLLSFALGVWMTPRYGPWAFFGPWTRAWEFGAGALVALVPLRSAGAALRPAGSWLGIGLILVSAVLYSENTAFPGTAALTPVLGTALVLALSSDGEPRGAAALLTNRAMVKIGDWSYSFYLWHWPVIVIPVTVHNGLPLWIKLTLAAACLPLAALTYRFVEEPGRNAGVMRRLPPLRTVTAAGTVGCVLAAGFVLVGFRLEDRLIASDRDAPAYDVNAPVEFTGFVPKNGEPRLQQANYDVPQAFRDGCAPGDFSSKLTTCEYGDLDADKTVVLFGDSHAAQWQAGAEAFATSIDAKLVVFYKSRCASIDVPRYVQGNIDRYCEQWKDRAVEELNTIHPDLVLLSNLRVRTAQDGSPVTAETWAAGTKNTLEAIDDSVPVVVIADSPWFDVESPVMCASTHLDDLSSCSVPRDEVVDQRWSDLEHSAVEAAGDGYVDMTDHYCSDVCGPYLGNVLIYRDHHHLTNTFVEKLAPAFVEEVSAAMR